MRLINVDDIKWQKGVFVNPMTDEPIPVIHKIATIEMLRDWQEEVKAIPLEKIKQAREEIIATNDSTLAIIEIMDSLIEESEGTNEPIRTLH